MTKKMTKFVFIESMTKIEVLGYTVRIWREQDELKQPWNYQNQDIIREINCIRNNLNKTGRRALPAEIIERIAKLPRVNAIEVLTPGGDGTIAYLNWP